METKHKTHVSDKKKNLVKKLAELLSKRTIMVVSIKNMPSSQFQEIRKKLRGMAEIRVAKKNLVDFALEHANNPQLKELAKHVEGNAAILFSDMDAFELSAFLNDNKSPAKAKAGQVSDQEIKIEAGPTELLPGPAITELSAVGLKVKVENGKLAIVNSHILIKVGETINDAKVGILSKLNITPFKIGLEPVAAYLDGKVYVGVKVDRQGTLDSFKSQFARACAFAVSLNYPSKETMPFMIGKAGLHEKAVSALIKQEVTAEAVQA